MAVTSAEFIALEQRVSTVSALAVQNAANISIGSYVTSIPSGGTVTPNALPLKATLTGNDYVITTRGRYLYRTPGDAFSQDDNITSIAAVVANLSARVTSIADNPGGADLTAVEASISALNTDVTTLQNARTSLESRINAVSALTDLSSVEASISALNTEVTTLLGARTSINTKITSTATSLQTQLTVALSSRVSINSVLSNARTSLESRINAVSALTGGSGSGSPLSVTDTASTVNSVTQISFDSNYFGVTGGSGVVSVSWGGSVIDASAGNALNLLRVNSGGTAFELSPVSTVISATVNSQLESFRVNKEDNIKRLTIAFPAVSTGKTITIPSPVSGTAINLRAARVISSTGTDSAVFALEFGGTPVTEAVTVTVSNSPRATLALSGANTLTLDETIGLSVASYTGNDQQYFTFTLEVSVR